MRTSACEDERHVVFHRQPLHAGGARLVRGFADARGPVVDITCTDGSREWGTIVLYPDVVPLVARAIADARKGRPGVAGETGRGQIRIVVSAGLREDGGPRLVFRRRAVGTSDEWRGRPVVLEGAELAAVERAIDWLSTGAA